MTVVIMKDLPEASVFNALSEKRLALKLGPFATRLNIGDELTQRFILDMYQEAQVEIGNELLCDFSMTVRPPNLYRRFFRKQIVPDPGFNFPAVPLPSALSPLALEMGLNLNVALQCFRFAIFHAGVVAKGSEALIISAKSGGGKSTLTAALMEDGFRLLSDEFAILDIQDATLKAYPRPVSLKNQAIDVVKAFAGSENVSATFTDTPKGNIAYRRIRASDVAAAGQPASASIILFPEFVEGAAPQITQIDLADAAMQLIASSPNYQVIGEPAFTALMVMLDGVQAFEIKYGNTEDSLEIVHDLLHREPS
ncbi:MAG: HprK-related kinase A [Alphaproteobacteria bacterium]|nr:HprK-related kinase A [Alphaproteobacteria bacterium]